MFWAKAASQLRVFTLFDQRVIDGHLGGQMDRQAVCVGADRCVYVCGYKSVCVCVCAQGSTELMILIGDPARSVVYLDEVRKS